MDVKLVFLQTKLWLWFGLDETVCVIVDFEEMGYFGPVGFQLDKPCG